MQPTPLSEKTLCDDSISREFVVHCAVALESSQRVSRDVKWRETKNGTC